MRTVFRWTLEEYEALAAIAERVFTDWRHPRHIELIRGYLKERGEPAKLSLDEYLRMVEAGIFSRRGKKRVELIRGEIREMSPIGNPHEEALSNLVDWSYRVVPQEVKIRVQCSIQLPLAKSAPEPDLVWAIRRSYQREKPGPADIHLLVEVADTSLAEDTGEKAEIYAAAGIHDYWVVNIPDQVVEVRRDPRPTGYASLTKYFGPQEIRSLAFSGVVLITDTLWQ
jgi:Uma2 family endonuclease